MDVKHHWLEPDLPPGVTHRLVLVRHGQPVESARGRCYGTSNVELSELGKAQISDTAHAFAFLRVTAMYSSSSRRALDSARILSHVFGAEVVVESGFAEIAFGHLEGMTYDEIAESHPEVFRLWMSCPTEVEFPGGESYRALRVRVLAAVRSIRERHPGICVVVVAHGGVIRTILSDALGMPDSRLFCVDHSYAGVSVIDYFGDVPVVRCVNWCPPPD